MKLIALGKTSYNLRYIGLIIWELDGKIFPDLGDAPFICARERWLPIYSQRTPIPIFDTDSEIMY